MFTNLVIFFLPEFLHTQVTTSWHYVPINLISHTRLLALMLNSIAMLPLYRRNLLSHWSLLIPPMNFVAWSSSWSLNQLLKYTLIISSTLILFANVSTGDTKMTTPWPVGGYSHRLSSYSCDMGQNSDQLFLSGLIVCYLYRFSHWLCCITAIHCWVHTYFALWSNNIQQQLLISAAVTVVHIVYQPCLGRVIERLWSDNNVAIEHTQTRLVHSV